MAVYLLSHMRAEDEDQDVKICGIYSSDQEARSAIQRLIIEPGFKDYPDGFSISEYVINTDYWTKGFGIEVD
jgi:hypothetical protein